MVEKEKTLLCYRIKRYDIEVYLQIMKYSHTDIVLVLQNNMERNYFLNNLMEDCIIKVITVDELLRGDIDHMKFDHEVGNPPYQKTIKNGGTTQIWTGLVLKFYALLKENGDSHMIHPGNWKTSRKKDFLLIDLNQIPNLNTEERGSLTEWMVIVQS